MNKKPFVLVASPLYEGMCHSIYKQSQIAFVRACMDYGITTSFKDLYPEADIRKARNILATQSIMRGFVSHILFWDGDIGVKAENLIQMIAMDKDVICAPCPHKELKWGNIREALRRNPDLSDDQLAGLASEVCLNLSPLGFTEASVNLMEPMNVLENGAGVMLIKTSALEKMTLAYPDEWYYENFSEPRGKRVWDFFQAGVDKSTRTYVSEDYAFCRRWAAIDPSHKVYVAPWIKTQHRGNFTFSGNLVDLMQNLGTLVEEPDDQPVAANSETL